MRNVNAAGHPACWSRSGGAGPSRPPITVGNHTVSQQQPPTTVLAPEFQLEHVMLGAPPSNLDGSCSRRLDRMLAALAELPALPG
jgi:hypothetical protein